MARGARSTYALSRKAHPKVVGPTEGIIYGRGQSGQCVRERNASAKNADGGEEAAGAGTLFPEAEEKIWTAGGAEISRENAPGLETRGEELGTVGFAEVEVDVFGRGLMARWHHVEPLERIWFFTRASLVEPARGFGKLGGELGNKFGPDFIATGADRRAESSNEIGRVTAELHLELANGFLGNARQSAAPTRVDCRDRAALGVDKQDGHAVGGLDRKQQAGSIGDRGVGFAGFRASGAEEMNGIGMDLAQREKRQTGSAESRLEEAPVFEDVFAGIPIGESEIENFPAVEFANAAGSGTETVEKPGEIAEGIELEDTQTAGGGQDPRRGQSGLPWRGATHWLGRALPG